MSHLSAVRAQITPSVLFPAGERGHAVLMADTQHDARVGEDTSSTQTEETRSPESPASTVARMLANPRRVRRD